MRKVVAIGAVLLLIGAVVMICGIIGAGNVVEEKTYNLSNPEEFREWVIASGKEDPTPPLIDPVIVLGGIVAASGVVFLVKSGDKDFLPGI